MVNCLAGCIGDYVCNENLKVGIDTAALLAPYIKLKIKGSDTEITVGNHSSPKFDNHAAVKSMQYGLSNGTGVVVEIVDEEGGSFPEFMKKISTCQEGIADKYVMECEWGWIAEKCDGSKELIKTESPHYFLMLHVSTDFSEGMFKFILEGVDLMEPITETKCECVYGSHDKPMPLKEALQQLFKNYTPSIPSVKFLRALTKGGTEEWEFDKNPKSCWRAEQRNALEAALEWIRPYKTDRGKGIFPAWNDKSQVPEIIFWEDYNPTCDEEISCKGNIGTYIVNGGSCSSVISFKTEWKWSLSTSGNVGGVVNQGMAKGEKQQNQQNCDIKANEQENEASSPGCAHGGLQINQQTSYNAMQTHGIPQATTETIKSDQLHQKANRNYEPISAELTIQGDPKLDNPIDLIGKSVGIVYINPFYVSKASDGCDWVTISNCNEVLSNKNWLINGASHDIREGSYTTTLKLFLEAPGATTGANSNVGSSSTGFMIPCKG